MKFTAEDIRSNSPERLVEEVGRHSSYMLMHFWDIAGLFYLRCGEEEEMITLRRCIAEELNRRDTEKYGSLLSQVKPKHKEETP